MPRQRGRDHAAEHRGADGALGGRTGARGDDQRHQTEDEGEGRHHDGAEPQAGAPSIAAVDDVLALAPLLHRELDDQDGVLGGERDQHDDADLGVDVVVQPDQISAARAPNRPTVTESRAAIGIAELS